MNDKIVITAEADELIIEPKNGNVIDLENSDLSVGKIVFKKKENELPTKWEDLCLISGYYVSTFSEVVKIKESNCKSNFNIFPTEGEAEASMALSQLCQLRDAYNGEPLANWCDWENENIKYCIYFYEEKICKTRNRGDRKILAFKTEKLRDEFAENFKYLIFRAKPLL